MSKSLLALLGGKSVREKKWPRWPQANSETLAYLEKVLASERWAISGPYRGQPCFEQQFAQAFADFCGVPYCTPTTSGTSALTLALLALGVGRGDEVILPGLTWVACASSVANIGAVPILADLDLKTLAIDVNKAREACSKRTAAIMIVHPFCTVADIDAFQVLAQEIGVPLIEDCAQAHGASWRNKRVGSYGAIGCFSMQHSKLLTCGEGGAVVTSDPELFDRIEQLRSDGRRFSDRPINGSLELIEAGGVQGRNLCLSEFQAAVLLDRLRHVEEGNKYREKRIRYLEEGLRHIDGVSVIEGDKRITERSCYNFVIRFDLDRFEGNSIDSLSRALAAELGTLVNPIYTPMNRHRLLCPTRIPRGDISEAELKRLDVSRFLLPNAEKARQTCLTLTHPVFLGETSDMDDIIASVKKVQANAGDLLGSEQGATTMAF